MLSDLALDSFGDFKGAGSSVFGQVKLGNQLSSSFISWASGFDLQCKLKFILREFVDQGDYPEGRLIILLNSVIHHQKLSVWRCDSECFQLIKI